MVDFKTPARGRRVLLGYAQVKRAIDHGPTRRRVGFLLEGKVPAREGADILTSDGQIIGRLTSGGFAPSLGRPIAMGYVVPLMPRPELKFH